MNRAEWFTRFVLPRKLSSLSECGQNDSTCMYFEDEPSNSNNGFQSEIFVKRIVYKDGKGNTNSSASVLVKVFPTSFGRSTFTEMIFSNEIFVYSKILPFYSSLNKNPIEYLFPKFHFGDLIFGGENEDGCVVLENLKESGYRASESRVFLDYQHLSLMMKKLGEFHAYSYVAKAIQYERFYLLVDSLMENDFSVLKTSPNFMQRIHNEVYIELLAKDQRYADKVEKLREIIKDADEFSEEVLNTRNEPVAVICHGDFTRNNVLFKYDSTMKPIDMKFVDVANMRYCTPVVDIGLVLYMNANQETRDKYWDELLNVYYESLQNCTFPNIVIPTKNQILSEFRRNVLQPYLRAMFFVPVSLEQEKLQSGIWFYNLLAESEYSKEYDDKTLSLIPTNVRVNIHKKIHKGANKKAVVDIITDIFNKDFV